MMILEDARQGSSAWHAARATRFCASEAAAALAVSKYQTRSALLAQKKTGIVPDVDAAKQRLFDAGHASEAAALPIAEEIAGVEFYPAVGVADFEGLPLLASFDGIDMLEEVVWENKLRNATLVGQVADRDLEPHYWAQLEHQLLVSGAKKALFTVSDGTPAGTEHMWYESVPERRARLIASWKQFAADLATFVPPEVVAEPVGRTPESLPALHIVLKGEVSASNLAEFKEVALTAIRSVNRDLKTDQDFADSAKARKWCEDIESRVAAAKEHALSQTATIDMLFRTMDEVSAEARDVRLALEKLEKARKETRKGEIVAGAIKALGDHVAGLNVRLGKSYMPPVHADFGGALKGLKTFDSMQNAVDTALANAKIAASATADRIDENLTHLNVEAAEYGALFPDLAAIVTKQTDDFAALVQYRVADQKAKEQKRADALAEQARDRIRKEEADRIEREQKATAYTPAPPLPAAVVNTLPEPIRTAMRPVAIPAESAKSVDIPPTLTLGQIGSRLGFSVTAEFMRGLGFEPTKVKASLMFHETDFDAICAALVEHIESVREAQPA